MFGKFKTWTHKCWVFNENVKNAIESNYCPRRVMLFCFIFLIIRWASWTHYFLKITDKLLRWFCSWCPWRFPSNVEGNMRKVIPWWTVCAAQKDPSLWRLRECSQEELCWQGLHILRLNITKLTEAFKYLKMISFVFYLFWIDGHMPSNEFYRSLKHLHFVNLYLLMYSTSTP